MRRNFLELRRFLLQNYPHVFSEENISGGTQPPPSNAMYFAQVTGTLQLIAVAFAFFGDSLWNIVPIWGGRPPPWWGIVLENKVAVMCFLFCVNSMANSQLSTGAFEIDMDGKIIFSKMEAGRMPNGDDIVKALEGMGYSPIHPL
uniref:Selenoprotein T n=1 Tax=Corethron hystrix TaxID=216773 RepID=A0A7S1BN41_9STRA|mmetsp:Transcript_32180/g.74061  ORF Transcript_32180/g.74061 Transcript_32180/m.74061 type:complete len:145 (+) Transcript_32180:468-902(+)|eukprot:CAMPEP_0113302192 /NCGR_PEP_ID=MMETSP0010_2-20120614/3107_1 /TAXON_ID=216773 ORGANISM="Corethron hystrix, Strain 308" /NCGR_SAMPLE_ID=MMETSP0010_2 /ASSEMBLY_ACC=CAM_ASM_000155 /LENGTH=144 /DNA_ID=CAMNT_0000155941 /DNA_START=422 /DNA_END=856 /DNA_ORIENTATION=+ /assembly_acc=CAM_ASM_000155